MECLRSLSGRVELILLVDEQSGGFGKRFDSFQPKVDPVVIYGRLLRLDPKGITKRECKFCQIADVLGGQSERIKNDSL